MAALVAQTLQEYSLNCPGSLYQWSNVRRVKWLHSVDGTNPLPYEENTHVSAREFDLVFRNVTGVHEGIYYCQAEYEDGSFSSAVAVGCVFIAGELGFYWIHIIIRSFVITCSWPWVTQSTLPFSRCASMHFAL